MVLLFDDAKKLEKAVGEEAAEVIVHILEKQDEKYKQELSTKYDIYIIRKDIAESEAKIKAKINDVKAEINAGKAETIKWVAGLLVVQAASIAALVKLL
ncbi:hypothetical protein [Maridesulfovibrio sp.]|uniref:hypothetical protein n=1 Tax=Maridesulfovibrio sp. TaxID=2795000 RepID=UPI0029F532FD|nr:hypothetical protein [Maridesulfovibrio sp.]